MQATNRTPSFFEVRGTITYLEMIWLSTMLTNVGASYGPSVSIVSFSKKVFINTIHISIYFSQKLTIIFYVIEQCLISLQIKSCCPNTHPLKWPEGQLSYESWGKGFQPTLPSYTDTTFRYASFDTILSLSLSLSSSSLI